MKKALAELWNSMPDSYNTSEDEKELMGYLERHRVDISEKLDDNGKQSLEKFEDCYSELFYMGCEDAFIKGFSLAVKLMTEALV